MAHARTTYHEPAQDVHAVRVVRNDRGVTRVREHWVYRTDGRVLYRILGYGDGPDRVPVSTKGGYQRVGVVRFDRRATFDLDALVRRLGRTVVDVERESR